ncbi:MAG: HEAT repeat domain-containing protein [Elusimicrobia bacterium]|nr:HEAT repeat domain-containing protein [Elusimicrobiota bacterium]
MRRVLLACVLFSGCGGLDTRPPEPALPPPPPRAPERPKPKAHDPLVLSAVLRLLGETDGARWAGAEEHSPALARLAAMGTPAGIRLWNRYTHAGAPLAEALATGEDAMLDNRIVEAARWSRHAEVRSAALRALAARGRSEDRAVFEEALVGVDPVLHFALAEALEIWERPEAGDLLVRVMNEGRSHLARVYAAQALLTRGRAEGRGELLKQLDGGDWVARAMAARALGLLGTPEDYQLLLDRMMREQANDFVTAEIAIGALRLFPRQQRQLFGGGSGAAPAPDESDLDALVVTAPRLKIPETALIDGRINATLLGLLERKAETGPSPEDLRDPSFAALAALVSPAGLELKTRYRRVGLLLTEGLAGTSDLILRERVLQVARNAADPAIRAAAMLAAAYSGDAKDRVLLEDGLASKEPAVRLGAIEACRKWGAVSRLGDPFSRLQPDASDALALYLAHGRIPAVPWLEDPDWVVRALAVRSLRGGQDHKLIERLASEPSRFVQIEICAALLRAD